jgi:hypothetical protein
MHNMTKISALVLGTFGLVACDGASEPFAFDPTFANFVDIEQALGGITTGVVDPGGEINDTDDVSDSDDFNAVTAGTVTYNGAIIAERDDADVSAIDSTLIGQLQVEVALATNTMEGRAGNFIDSEDGVYTGTLLGNTTFLEVADPDNDVSHFDMTLSGALSNGGNAGSATVTLDGYFLNDGSDLLDIIAGGAIVDLGDAGPDYEDGAFAATR